MTPSSPRSSAPTAARASGCVFAALTALQLTGRIDLALYATFGAFTSVYGGGARPGRWRSQAGAGLVLVAAASTGVLVGLLDERRWVLIPVAALWAGVAAALSDRLSWRPPGPLFPTFAVAACGSVPTVVADVLPAVATVLGTAVLAVLVGYVEESVVGRHGLPPDGRATRSPATAAAAHPRHRQRVQLVRCIGVVLVAGTLATSLGIGHPYWAMVSAVVPFAAVDLEGQLTRGVHRVVGTGVGLVIAGALLTASPSVWVVVVLAAGLQGLTELVVTRNYAVALLFITPLALVLGQLANHQAVGSLLGDRLVETLLGVVIGMLVALATRDRAPATSSTT